LVAALELINPHSAFAEETTNISPYSVSFNLGIYSNNMFRGIDYTGSPAIQGGVDLTHISGLYLGSWFSNLDPNAFGKVPNVSNGNHWETDFYAGYTHAFENGLGVNFLGNYYKYLEGKNQAFTTHKQDSFETSLAISYKWLTYTYFNVLTDYYGLDEANNSTLTVTGNRNTKYSDYHELKINHNLPVGNLIFMAKVGYQSTTNLQGDEADFAIGLNRNFSLPTSSGKAIEGFNAGAYYTGTFAVKNEAFYVTTDGRDTNEDKLWFYVKRTW
jgi:uncharacterized protein (TIGR02001 family)